MNYRKPTAPDMLGNERIMPRCPRCGRKFIEREYSNALCMRCTEQVIRFGGQR